MFHARNSVCLTTCQHPPNLRLLTNLIKFVSGIFSNLFVDFARLVTSEDMRDNMNNKYIKSLALDLGSYSSALAPRLDTLSGSCSYEDFLGVVRTFTWEVPKTAGFYHLMCITPPPGVKLPRGGLVRHQ
jgi:hypothetical protein